ncbi:hypothetical protein [Staphylococcus saprophyticus]|jgi:hypothetical protein|uniref:hypothetical protein n=1 Tax=Staphylococcus saprophyticus TaxID=29385 RepID=UPI000D1AC1EE|nr:hypothetical protein [Staphylococcus saprophyticus]PTG42496.1 hypothetical protein BUY24_02695 [Staphylococcus cohnii]HLQ82457.1 hypothetical protein [Pseudogracilibacillus sp.]MBC2921525.1 hypothetical protein [Staphylococcus saprophyticus]MBC2957764.1 hypothetical protein [Staphylococcus saprophyticus]MBC3009861.1 hypothetical protein [Staphylococcus saprophyticus]
MNDLGNTVIENFNTFPPSNTFLDWVKFLATPAATIIVGLLVYWYTNAHHKRTLLNELDSKSEWRKTLFVIAGKDKITLEDVFKLRACLRFDTKDNPHNIFDKKTNQIIEFCEEMKTKYDNKYSCESKILFIQDREKVRIYSRYLLANHWEILQLTKKDYKKYEMLRNKEKEQGQKKNKEQKLNASKSWYKKEQELDEKTNELINKLTP